jgi:triacylglycerol esterase/lipase EstA (alpha/beta hydrolase family)
MLPVARDLARRGYGLLNQGYPSRRQDLAALAAHIEGPVAAMAARTSGRLHFVTHSLGGLVARALLTRWRPERLGRVVMLVPPNGGSELADLLLRWPRLAQIVGPVTAQLATRRSDEVESLLGPVDFELGVIAASRSLYPLASRLLPSGNDGRVSLAATRVTGMRDHRVVAATHPTVLNDREARALVLRFLETGSFAER